MVSTNTPHHLHPAPDRSHSSMNTETTLCYESTLDAEQKSTACSCGEGVSKWDYVKAKCEAHYWQSQHARALEREKVAKEKIEHLEAKIRLREQQLFGNKSEQTAHSEKSKNTTTTFPKKRGQQRGQKGHGRQANNNLSVKEEVLDLPEAERCCPTCQLPYETFPGTDDSE